MVIAVVLPERDSFASFAKCISIFNQVSWERVGNIQNTQTSLSCLYYWEQINLRLSEQIPCLGIWDRTASLLTHQKNF